jgi:hypothetical protein
VIRTQKTGFSQWLFVLLIMQHALAAVAVAASGPEHHQGVKAAAAEASVHCEAMRSEQAGSSEMLQQGHQDCIESGCDNCVGCVACLPLAINSFPLPPGQQTLILSIELFSAPQPDSLYRPPIDC